MNREKITVSLEEVNSSLVDMELHRQNVAERMSRHQEKIRMNYGSCGEMLGGKRGIFRIAMVYMAAFGLAFSVLGWGLGEVVLDHPFENVSALFYEYASGNYQVNWEDFKAFAARIRSGDSELMKDPYLSQLRDNPYLAEEFLNQPPQKLKQDLLTLRQEQNMRFRIFYILVAICISIGLSIAEACVSKNFLLALKNGFLAALLGAAGGFLISLFIDRIYQLLGGGVSSEINLRQIAARAIAWLLLGLFMAIAPGISMKSGKKIFLGCMGGALGGFLGGVLFDPICDHFQWVVLARFVNVVGMGVCAAVATVLLENMAKQGWLKVADGVIAGKQFILYRNPTVIGSSPKCEIYLFKDPLIFSHHAAINNHHGEFVISSINGASVLVNGMSVGQHRLRTGDQIRIGNTVFIFETKVLERQGA